MLKLPNGTIRVLVEGLHRAEIIRYVEEDDEYKVEINKLEDIHGDSHEEEALMRSASISIWSIYKSFHEKLRRRLWQLFRILKNQAD